VGPSRGGSKLTRTRGWSEAALEGTEERGVRREGGGSGEEKGERREGRGGRGEEEREEAQGLRHTILDQEAEDAPKRRREPQPLLLEKPPPLAHARLVVPREQCHQQAAVEQQPHSLQLGPAYQKELRGPP